MINIASLLEVSARRCPEATAVVYRGRRSSFRRIEQLANRIANGLSARGIGPGSRVALCCHNRVAQPAAYFGILKTGATLVSLNTYSSVRDLDQGLRQSGAEALLSFDRYDDMDMGERSAEAVARNETCRDLWLIPPDPEGAPATRGERSLADLIEGASDSFRARPVGLEDVAVIAFTSGTSGKRKGVETRHRNLAAMTQLTAQLADPETGRVRIVENSLDCLMGQVFTLISPVYLGHCMVLLETDDFDVVLDETERWSGSYMANAPYFYRQLLDAALARGRDEAARSLRLCVTGGVGLPPTLSEEFESVFGVPLLTGYGTSETTTAISWTCPGEAAVPGSVGRPLPGVEVKIVGDDGQALPAGEAGEIWVQSPGTMKGYLDMPEETRRVLVEGWFRTGDRGFLDEQGALTVQGRMDNKIIGRVDHIDPVEVEQILREHPAVEQAKVVARPHAQVGQEAHTFVVLKRGAKADGDALIGWLQRQLPVGKAPDSLEFVRALPLGPAPEGMAPSPTASVGRLAC